MPTTEHAGAKLYYEWRDKPDGAPDTPLVLLRGLSRSLRFWLDIADRFSERWHLLLMDNRGIGRSSDDGRPYRVGTLADDVAAVLDAAGVDRAHVFGLSLGGMIAQELALRHPERVDRLVLGATTPGPRHGQRPSPRTVATLLGANAFPWRFARAFVEPLLVEKIQGEARRATLDAWTQLTHDEPPTRWGVLRQMLAAQLHDTWDRLPLLRAPTLCIVGSEDRLMPKANTRLLTERIPNARYEEMAGCGHDFPADDPAEAVDRIHSFLAG